MSPSLVQVVSVPIGALGDLWMTRIFNFGRLPALPTFGLAWHGRQIRGDFRQTNHRLTLALDSDGAVWDRLGV